MKIGLFGITANPPHYGHLYTIKEALSHFDEVWVSPVYIHPFSHKKPIDYNHRLIMTELLLNNLSTEEQEKIKIYELDKFYYFKHNKTPYSYDLLNTLSQQFTEHSFKLIIGEDNWKPEIWNKFYKAKEIVEQYGVVVTSTFSVHSTDIRNSILSQKDITSFTFPNIVSYISEHGLYKEQK